MVKLVSLLLCCSYSSVWGHNGCAIIMGDCGHAMAYTCAKLRPC